MSEALLDSPAVTDKGSELRRLVLEYQESRCSQTFDAILAHCRGLLFYALRPVFVQSTWARRNRDEVIEAATLALWKAALKYDPARGEFAGYAWHYMYRAGMSCSKAAAAMRAETISLNVPTEDGTAELLDLMADPHGQSPEDYADQREANVNLLALVDETCMTREAAFIRAYFWQGKTKPEIAEAAGTSKQRVQQIIDKGLGRMERAIRREQCLEAAVIGEG